MTISEMRIALVANSAWYLFNFRLNLARALMQAGHQVMAVGVADGYEQHLIEAGLEFQPFHLKASGVNPIREVMSVVRLRQTFSRAKIELIFSYTPKGNIYSGLAAGRSGIRFAPNVSGLGKVFITPYWVTPIVRALYKRVFQRAVKVFFQNADDLRFFLDHGLALKSHASLLPGSGVDLDRFQPSPLPGDQQNPTFLMIARVLWDKGTGEYLDVARTIRADHPNVRFILLGPLGVDNPSAVPQAVIESAVKAGDIRYHSATDDVRPYLAAADCVVLPSYREGVPRTLLEAAASGRPVITTNAPGCREALIPNSTGFMCEARSAVSLQQAVIHMISLSKAEREAMGQAGRAYAVARFDERNVIREYVALAEEFAST